MTKTIFTLLLVGLVGYSIAQGVKNPQDCSEFKVSENISQESSGTWTIEITLESKGGKLRYVFYDEDGNLLNQNFESNKVVGLSPGKYGYTVVSEGGCKVSKKLEIK